ncbi:cadmium-translocating P-type ATPase [bacterium D16-51]|nr:cadmium-translocating P-type ATPase [bacterium D16-59]RKI60652.1 cadmium-translocating P-type ATPase [bacterium D16-51]
MRKKYSITGIDCANCAAKLESKMNGLPQVEEVILTFATQQLLVVAENPDEVIPALQEIADRVEPGTKIGPLSRRKNVSAEHGQHHGHHHEHGEECNCGHEHHHEHGKECGCGHEHHHEHGEECNCGHEHHHEHGEECNCGQEHHHGHGKECRCGQEHHHEHEEEKSVGKQELAVSGKDAWWKNTDAVTLLSGAVLFGAAILLENFIKGVPYAGTICFLAAYIVLGGQIVLTAVRNLFRGKVFDENFLMTIATAGAFVIGDFAEAVGVMLFYRIGEFFEEIAVDRSRKQIMDAVDMRPETVRIYKEGKVTEVSPEEVFVGDCIEIRPGDRIPLDGTVLKGESRIDTSAVTGEPVPVAVKEGSQIFSGCVNTSGVIYLRVDKVLEDSMVTRILEAVENAAASKPKMDRFITKFARIYTPFVVLLAAGTAVLPSLITGEWQKWIYTALSFLIISCPCALVLSVPLAFFAGIGAGSKLGILFKGGVSLEMLAEVKAVIMDKTGTITEGNFMVESVKAEEGFTGEQVIAWAACAESSSSHPIADSIREEAVSRGILAGNAEEIQEISGEGIEAVTGDGKILCGNRKLMLRHAVKVPSGDLENAGTEVFVAYNQKYAGCLVINDRIKPDSKDAVQEMKKQGLYTAMLTGDTEKNAQAVQKQTGIQEVFARQMPEDKLKNLGKIRDSYGSVMFIGDGINDAPVLAGADVGAAMGSGADAAIEAADVVFMTSRLTALVESFKIAKVTNRIAKENVVFALAVKAAVMVLGLCGIASMWMAVFADSGVAMLCVLNSIRVLYHKN